jgi:hypothetical protein
MPEGGGEVVEKLLRDDVVPTGYSAGARSWWIGGSTGGRAAAELGAHRRCGEQHSGARKQNWVGR